MKRIFFTIILVLSGISMGYAQIRGTFTCEDWGKSPDHKTWILGYVNGYNLAEGYNVFGGSPGDPWSNEKIFNTVQTYCIANPKKRSDEAMNEIIWKTQVKSKARRVVRNSFKCSDWDTQEHKQGWVLGYLTGWNDGRSTDKSLSKYLSNTKNEDVLKMVESWCKRNQIDNADDAMQALTDLRSGNMSPEEWLKAGTPNIPTPGGLISGTKGGDKIYVFNPRSSPAVLVYPEGFVSSSIVSLNQGNNKNPELDIAAAMHIDAICATKQYRFVNHVNGKRIPQDWKSPPDKSISQKIVDAMCVGQPVTRSNEVSVAKPASKTPPKANFVGKISCWAVARARIGHGREKIQMVSIDGMKGVYRGVPSPAGHASGTTELDVIEVTNTSLLLKGKGSGGADFEVKVNRGTGEYVAILAPGFEASKGECAAGENKF